MHLRTCRRLLLLAAAILWVPSGDIGAQARPPQPGSITVAGRVVRQDAEREVPLPGVWVVLHRVTPERAGPIDSLRTDGRGGFRFVIRPDSGAFYLASAQYAGIAYFSPPSGAGMAAAPPSSEIAVFDTTSADVPVVLQGRHLVVSAPNANGVRSVIDVLEIENTGRMTRVSGGSDRPTFSLLLPDAARNPRASQGGSGEAPVEMVEGRARLFTPLSPGLRQVVLTYELAAEVFPLSLPVEATPGMLEVLLEDTTGTASGAGLASEGVVSVDGRSFARFLGRQVPRSAVVRIALPSSGGGSGAPPWLLPLLLALAALGALVVSMRRPAAAPTDGAPAEPVDEAIALAHAAATLDAVAEAPTASLDDAGRAAIRDERERVAQRLRAVLARRTMVR